MCTYDDDDDDDEDDEYDTHKITSARMIIILITKATILEIIALRECLRAASKSPLFHAEFT